MSLLTPDEVAAVFVAWWPLVLVIAAVAIALSLVCIFVMQARSRRYIKTTERLNAIRRGASMPWEPRS